MVIIIYIGMHMGVRGRERSVLVVRVVKEGSICKVQEKRKRERCWFFCVSEYKN